MQSTLKLAFICCALISLVLGISFSIIPLDAEPSKYFRDGIVVVQHRMMLENIPLATEENKDED